MHIVVIQFYFYWLLKFCFFRESFWPNGILAEATPVREDSVKLRTRVTTKAKMFSGIPGMYMETDI